MSKRSTSSYQQYVSANPRNARKFLDSDKLEKKKPFEDVSFNRKGKKK